MPPYRASILQDAVGETTVTLGSDLNLIGTLEEKGLFKVSSSGVHVGNAVLAVVCEVLGCLSGHEAQEGQLDVDILWQRALAAILKLCRKNKSRKVTDLAGNLKMNDKNAKLLLCKTQTLG